MRVCAVCGLPEVSSPSLCAEHERVWSVSGEHGRFLGICNEGGVVGGRLSVAFMDFVNRLRAETLNAGNGQVVA